MTTYFRRFELSNYIKKIVFLKLLCLTSAVNYGISYNDSIFNYMTDLVNDGDNVIVTIAETNYSSLTYKDCQASGECRDVSIKQNSDFETKIAIGIKNLSISCLPNNITCFFNFKENDNQKSRNVKLNMQIIENFVMISIMKFKEYSSFLLYSVNRLQSNNKTTIYQPVLKKVRTVKNNSYIKMFEKNSDLIAINLTDSLVNEYKTSYIYSFETDYIYDIPPNPIINLSYLHVLRRERINDQTWTTKLGLLEIPNFYLTKYVEIDLRCDDSNMQFKYARNAYYMNEILFVSFNKYDENNATIDESSGTVFCGFTLEQISITFQKSISDNDSKGKNYVLTNVALYRFKKDIQAYLIPYYNTTIVFASNINEKQSKIFVQKGDCSVENCKGKVYDLATKTEPNCFEQEHKSHNVSGTHPFIMNNIFYMQSDRACIKGNLNSFQYLKLGRIIADPFRPFERKESNMYKIQLIRTIIATVLISFFLLALIFLKMFLFNVKKNKSSSLASILKQENKEILIDNSIVKIGEKIGKGNFGIVHKGEIRLGINFHMEVALKTMRLMSEDKLEIMRIQETIFEEANVMKNFRHQNVLTLIGVCLQENSIPMIILPFMAKGSLLDLIKSESNSISVKKLLEFAVDIGNGMHYLSESKFVHRDLAARNCMLDENYSVRVSDFGLTRDIYSCNYYRFQNLYSLPVRWMSPESLQMCLTTCKGDVWSFGIVLWELMTRGNLPYANLENDRILYYLNKGNRLPKPDACPLEIYYLMLDCWQHNPLRRPSFDLIVERIQKVIDGNSDLEKIIVETVTKFSYLDKIVKQYYAS